MVRYIFKRVIVSLVVACGVMFAGFVLGRMTPADVMTSTDPQQHYVCPELEKDPFNFKKPLLEQYRLYLLSLLKSRSLFSRSYLNDKKSFFKDLNTNNAMVYSFFLAAMVIFLALSLSYLLSVYVVYHRNSKKATLIYLAVTFVYFLIPRINSTYFREVFQTRWGICAGNGVSDVYFIDFQHWLLPALFGGIQGAASLFRIFRDQFYNVINSDYVRTARAKGIPEDQIVVHHATLPMVLPCLNFLAAFFSTLFVGSVLVEHEFSIPGIGGRSQTASSMRDHNFLIPLTIYFFMMQQLLLLLLDLIRMWLDPKIKKHLLGNAPVSVKKQ